VNCALQQLWTTNWKFDLKLDHPTSQTDHALGERATPAVGRHITHPLSSASCPPTASPSTSSSPPLQCRPRSRQRPTTSPCYPPSPPPPSTVRDGRPCRPLIAPTPNLAPLPDTMVVPSTAASCHLPRSATAARHRVTSSSSQPLSSIMSHPHAPLPPPPSPSVLRSTSGGRPGRVQGSRPTCIRL
jgi:hypothetical protein